MVGKYGTAPRASKSTGAQHPLQAQHTQWNFTERHCTTAVDIEIRGEVERPQMGGQVAIVALSERDHAKTTRKVKLFWSLDFPVLQ